MRVEKISWNWEMNERREKLLDAEAILNRIESSERIQSLPESEREAAKMSEMMSTLLVETQYRTLEKLGVPASQLCESRRNINSCPLCSSALNACCTEDRLSKCATPRTVVEVAQMHLSDACMSQFKENKESIDTPASSSCSQFEQNKESIDTRASNSNYTGKEGNAELVAYYNAALRARIGYVQLCGCAVHILVKPMCDDCLAHSDWADIEQRGSVRVRHYARHASSKSSASSSALSLADVVQELKAPSERPDKSQCSRCPATATSRCARCKSVAYCSRACQRADWPTHKEQCK
jgi:MYND finger